MRGLAALYGLHNDDGLAVLAGHLIALAGLDRVALPVGIVDLQLDKINIPGIFRVMNQYSLYGNPEKCKEDYQRTTKLFCCFPAGFIQRGTLPFSGSR